MMERSDQIGQYLGLHKINHGKVFTIEIAIPPSEIKLLSPDRRKNLGRSLQEYKSNLIPLILRRTDQYGEDEEYEVIYGADWVLVAKELEVEKLWAWVFELNDKQAKAIQFEMEQLANNHNSKLERDDVHSNPPLQQSENSETVKQKIQPIITKISYLQQELETIAKTANDFIKTLDRLRPEIDENFDSVQLKPNLMTATSEEIKTILRKNGSNKNQINAAINTVKYWKERHELSFENLKKSTQAGEHKKSNFGKGTYQKLEDLFQIKID